MTKRRKSIKRRIANIVFYLLILLFILFGLLVAATDTQVGFRTALHLASPVIKTLGLSITGPVNGTLYDFHLAGLTIQRDGRIIRLNHVALKWNPKRLIHRHLMVKSVSADVQWPIEEPPHVIKPTSKAITTAQAINIPVLNFEVDINQLHLQLMKSSSKKLLDLNGSLDLHQGKLSIKHLKLTGSGLQTTLTGFIDQFTHSQIALVGHWAYAHKHMSLAGQLNIQGNFDDYKINFTANQRHNVLPMNLHISALGNLSGLKSQTFTFKRENGTATGHFNLQFIPLKWSVALTGKSIDWKEEIEANDPLLNFNLKASGDEQKQQLTGQASVNKNKALFDATRTANGDIELKHLTLDSEAGIWRVDPTTFYKDADGFHIPNTCIRQKTNHVCLEASLAGKALKGELLVHLLDISPFADFTPDVSEMTGALSGKMALSGTSSRPIFKGNVALKNGDFSLPGLGLDLKNAKANFSTKGNSTVYVQAQTNSGPGLLKTGGAITWKGNHLVVALGITGKNVLVANLPEASVLVSPQLAFVLNPKLILLNGSVQVEKADINANQFEQSASLDTKNIVYINAENQAINQSRTWPFGIEIQTFAKNSINFRGYGIRSTIGGKLFISSLPGQPTLATGKLTVNKGTYQKYGKAFNVTKGSLIFNQSPIDDPALDVYAQYELNMISTDSTALNQLEVGVHVTGSLKHIRISLFSNPSMTQENILSYILTGGPIEQAGPGAQVALSQAALSLATGGEDESLLDQIKDKLQLNQLSVGSLNSGPSSSLAASRASESGDQNNTAVFVGKSITKRFSVSYGVGLFNDQQIFRTHFRLTNKWALQTDNSTLGSGADIIYTFER